MVLRGKCTALVQLFCSLLCKVRLFLVILRLFWWSYLMSLLLINDYYWLNDTFSVFCSGKRRGPAIGTSEMHTVKMHAEMDVFRKTLLPCDWYWLIRCHLKCIFYKYLWHYSIYFLLYCSKWGNSIFKWMRHCESIQMVNFLMGNFSNLFILPKT